LRGAASLLVVFGCAEPSVPTCPDLEPDNNFPNNIQPFEVAIDATARLVYLTALGTPTVAVVDMDTATLVGMIPLGGSAVTRPDLAVDADGSVWVVGEKGFGAMRVNRTSLESFESDLLIEGDALLPGPDGSMLLTGQAGPGVPWASGAVLLGVGPDGGFQAGEALADGAPGLISIDDGARVGVILRTGQLEIRDASTLVLEETCELPFSAQRGAQLDSGAIVVSDDTHIGVVPCRGVDGWATEIGVENKDVISLGDSALVLDRIGADGWDPNLGVAWRVTATGVDPLPAFETAKNTGYGALDPVTGLVWMNSEGTGEVWAMDPTTGEIQAEVRTGLFVDGLAISPSQAGRRYVTGRLTDTVLRVDDGALSLDVPDAVRWPWSPVIDEDRGLLWLLSQTSGVVHGFDLDTLSWVDSIETKQGPNPLLTFSGLGLDPHTGDLWLAESNSDQLLRISPEDGADATLVDPSSPTPTPSGKSRSWSMTKATSSSPAATTDGSSATSPTTTPATSHGSPWMRWSTSARSTSPGSIRSAAWCGWEARRSTRRPCSGARTST
jgi:hypothetical protein